MSKEEFLSVLTSERTDRVPFYLFDVTLGMELSGYDTDEIFVNGFDGEKSARSLIASYRHFGLDASNGAVMWFDNRVFGNDVVFPKKGIPYNSGFALYEPSNLYELDNSSIPKDLLNQLALSHEIVSENIDGALVNHTPSPLGAASALRGLQSILMDMLQEPDYVKDILDFCTETTKIVYERICKDVCIDVCLISGAYDNIDIVGEGLLEKFSTRPLKDTIGFAKDSGAKACFHPHGTLSAPGAESTVSGYQDMGVDCLYYGEYNNPLKIHEYAPNMSLMGGIDTFTTIILGDDDRVRNDSKECIERMEELSYIFSCSCSVDRGLPIDKLDLMRDTVKGFTFS